MRALLLILPLFVYLALPTRNYYWDGVVIALNIEKHTKLSQLLHPNHLIYGIAGSGMYWCALAFGIKTRALFLMQTANSVLAGCCVPLLHRILSRAGLDEGSCHAATLTFAFSAMWWKFATDANAYVPSVFFLLCAYLLLEGRHVIMAALAHAAAMLFHELAIFFLPVAWVMLRNRQKHPIQYGVCALAPVATAYVAAYRAAIGETAPPGLISWMTSHSADSGFFFNPFRDAFLTIRGTLRLLFGGRVSDFDGSLFSTTALVGLLAAVAIFLWALRRHTERAKSAALLPLVVWAVSYMAFLFFWMPQNTFYRLFYAPALIGTAIALSGRTPAMLFVPIVLLWNLTFLIYPQSRPETNAPLRFAIAQRERWVPGTPILFHHFHPDLWTICYFSPGTPWISLERPDIPSLDRALDYAHSQQKPLWIEADAQEMIAATPSGRQWLSKHDRLEELLEFRDGRHDFRFYCAR